MRSLDEIEDRVTVWRLIHKARARRDYPLTVRELKVLLWRFGFLGGDLREKEIGAELGISAPRVNQIGHKALTKLRRAAKLMEARTYGYYSARPAPVVDFGRQRPVEEVARERKHPPKPPLRPDDYGPMPMGEMVLTCDHCGRRQIKTHIWHNGGPTPADKQHKLWEMARSAGWSAGAGYDLCPECQGRGWAGSHGPGSDPLPGADQPADGGHQCGTRPAYSIRST